MTGTAGQRHALVHGHRTTWILPLTGDGGDSGFDATDPHLRFHTYTGGQMDINYNDADRTSWLWIGDRFVVNFPEAAALLLAGRLRPGRHEDDLRRRAERLADVERRRRPRVPRGALQRDLDHRRGPEQPALHRGLWYARRLAEARHVDADEQRGDLAVRHDEGRQHDLVARAWPGRRHDVGGHRRRPRADLEEHQRRRSGERDVHPARHGSPQPGRAVSSIFADPTDPNHAIVTFSGYDVDDGGDAGTRLRRRVRPGTGPRRGRTSPTTSATSRSTTPSWTPTRATSTSRPTSA